MIKILHTADVHLDSPLRSLALRDDDLRHRVQTATRAAFTRIVDAALKEGAAALLISGDLFDRRERSARTAAFLIDQLDRLREGGVRAFYVKGNHDAENPLTGQLSMPDNVHVFDGRGGKVQLTDEVWIHGVSFPKPQAPESLLPKFPAPVDDAFNVALLHTSLSGAEGHDPYAPCSVRDLEDSGFDYWALGHVHRRQVHSKRPWIVMPGTPQGRHIGERGPKSCTLLRIDDTIDVEEVPTSVLEFLDVQIDTTEVESDEGLRDLLRKKMRATERVLEADSGVVRVTFTGSSPHHWHIQQQWDVWRELAAQACRNTGRLWLDRLVLELSDAAAPGQSATDELADIMGAMRQEPGFREMCRTQLNAVMADLPAAAREHFADDEDAMEKLAQRLAKEGAQRILARMKGAATDAD